MEPSNINDTFFNGFYKDVWRKLVPEGLTEAEIDFIKEITGLQEGQKVLDIMCGYGRHALTLARQGFSVTAVDNSKEYISEIETYAKAEKLNLTTILSSVLELKLEQTYDAIICMGNSFAFFNEEEATSVLKNLSKHLNPGGVFLINTWMLGEIAIKHYREKDWFYAENYKYLVDNRYCFNPTRIESEHIIIRSDGETEHLKAVDYIFTVSELDKILQNGGFSLGEIYSTPRKRKFQFGDTRAYIVAKRSN